MTCERPSCTNAAQRDGRCGYHLTPAASRAKRTVRLTAKGLEAVGVRVLVPVPLLDIPYREEVPR